MIEINLTPPDQEELFVVASDASVLHDFLRTFNFLPEDERRFENAIHGRGVTLNELLSLTWNAAIHAVTKNTTAVMLRGLPCNLSPACEQDLGHQGHCDPEECDFW